MAYKKNLARVVSEPPLSSLTLFDFEHEIGLAYLFNLSFNVVYELLLQFLSLLIWNKSYTQACRNTKV